MGRSVISYSSLIVALLFMISLLITSTGCLGDGKGDYPPPENGDWIITNETHIFDEKIELDGNLTVSENATLRLENVTLRINSSSNDVHGIYVEKGGNFEVYNSTITNLSGPYIITILGNMTLESSTVSNMMYGIDIEAGDSFIGNCTIYNNNQLNQYGFRVNGSPFFYNNYIHSNQRGIVLNFGASPKILNNTITNNEYGILCVAYGFSLIKGNNISDNSVDGISVELGHFEIHDNIITSNGGFGIISDHASINASNNFIYDNGRWGIFCWGAPLKEENNLYVKDGQTNSEGGVLLEWDVLLRVVDEEDEPVENAKVTIRNAQGKTIWQGNTISNVRTLVLREYEVTSHGDKIAHSPYNIVTSKGDLFDSSSKDISDNEEIVITVSEPAPYEIPLWGLITIYGIWTFVALLIVIGIIKVMRDRRQRMK